MIVIAQDTTYYGLDLYGKRRLAELLEALCRIDGIRWIRPEQRGDGTCPEPLRQAVRHDGLSRPEPFDDARRYDTRPRENAPLYVGKFVTGKIP